MIQKKFFIIFFFFFNYTATPELYTLSLHDALPIQPAASSALPRCSSAKSRSPCLLAITARSEEHTSELQSRENLVCQLLLEKKKKKRLKGGSLEGQSKGRRGGGGRGVG